jgi:hypothetical protein
MDENLLVQRLLDDWRVIANKEMEEFLADTFLREIFGDPLPSELPQRPALDDVGPDRAQPEESGG